MKFAILLVVLMSSVALAETQGSDWTYSQTRKNMYAFGRCIVSRQGDKARAYVLQRGFASGSLDDVEDKCLGVIAGGSQLRFPGTTLGYYLADALIRRDYAAQMPDLKGRQLPIVATPAPTEEYKKWQSDPKNAAKVAQSNKNRENAAYLADIGRCVVNDSPKLAYELLMVDPETPAERVKLQPIIALLPKCVTASQQLSVDAMSLRGSLALIFYRLANAPFAPASEVPHA